MGEERTTLTDEGALLLARPTQDGLYHAVRDAVRQRLYFAADCLGWVVIHAAAALIEDCVVMFVGQRGAGKTSSVLTICTRLPGARFIADDRVLLNGSDRRGVGFPAGVLMGPTTRRMLAPHLGGEPWLEKYAVWPRDASRGLGFGLASGGPVGMLIAPNFRGRAVPTRVRKANARDLLLRNVLWETLEDDNWWGMQRPSADTYDACLHEATWPDAVPAYEVVSNGIGPEYGEVLLPLAAGTANCR